MKRHPDASGNLILDEGDYGQKDGIWYVRPPGHHIESIPHHVVSEHEDGTVTAMPSILTKNFHVRLIKGEFTEVEE